jgi:dTDP-glucose pyrophosphorylase
MAPQLVVLAAGMGSRYGGLKQIDPIGPNGETIIDYSIYDAIRAGFEKVVFVIRKDIEADFKEAVGNRFESHIQVSYAFQELDALPEGYSLPEGRSKPWGTGHAILVAKSEITQPFLVINGDDFYGATSFKVAADYLKQAKDGDKADYMMVGFELAKTLSENGTVSRGICQVDEQQHLVEVVERTKVSFLNGILCDQSETPPLTLDETASASMNMFGFTPSLFEHLEHQFVEFLKQKGQELKSEFYIPSVVNETIQKAQAHVKVLQTPDQWYGVTYREDRPMVKQGLAKLIQQGLYPEKLF